MPYRGKLRLLGRTCLAIANACGKSEGSPCFAVASITDSRNFSISCALDMRWAYTLYNSGLYNIWNLVCLGNRAFEHHNYIVVPRFRCAGCNTSDGRNTSLFWFYDNIHYSIIFKIVLIIRLQSFFTSYLAIYLDFFNFFTVLDFQKM